MLKNIPLLCIDRAKELESLVKAAFPGTLFEKSGDDHGNFWVGIRRGNVHVTVPFLPNAEIVVTDDGKEIGADEDLMGFLEVSMPSVSEAFEFVVKALNGTS